MQPSIKTLGQILYSPSQYAIPVYQRNYRWESPQWQKLWESLGEIALPNKVGNHFMGFLVFIPDLAQPGQNTTFNLIDGQQRLTTLSLLLVALRNIARETGDTSLSEKIHQYYLVHPLEKGEQHYRLLPKKRDHDTYLAIINGKGEPTGRMVCGTHVWNVNWCTCLGHAFSPFGANAAIQIYAQLDHWMAAEVKHMVSVCKNGTKNAPKWPFLAVAGGIVFGMAGFDR